MTDSKQAFEDLLVAELQNPYPNVDAVRYLRRRIRSKIYYDPCDPNPVALPVGTSRPPTLQDQIARLRHDAVFVNQAARMAVMDDLVETEDELNDFYTGDDDRLTPVTKHELVALTADAVVAKKKRKLFKSFEEREGLPDPMSPPAEPKEPL